MPDPDPAPKPEPEPIDLDAIEREAKYLEELKGIARRALVGEDHHIARDNVYVSVGGVWLRSDLESHCLALVAECRRLREACHDTNASRSEQS